MFHTKEWNQFPQEAIRSTFGVNLGDPFFAIMEFANGEKNTCLRHTNHPRWNSIRHPFGPRKERRGNKSLHRTFPIRGPTRFL